MVEEVDRQKPSLIGMITSPTEQFKRIRERPVIWVAMGIIIVLFVVGTWTTLGDIDIAGEISQQEGVPLDEDLEAFAEFFANVTLFLTGIIGPLLGALIYSAIYLLIAKIANSAVTFRQLFSMSTYIMFVAAIGVLLNGVLYATFGGDLTVNFTSLGKFIDLDGVGGVIVDRIDVFSIWHIILTAIGLRIVARFSKGLAWGIPIVIFIGGILMGIATLNIQL